MIPEMLAGSLSMVGGLLSAQARRRAALARAAQDYENAKIAKLAAGDAIGRGQVAEGSTRRAATEQIARDTNTIASSGVDIKSGSSLDILAGQRTRGELAALTVRTNAVREAWGHEMDARNFQIRGDQEQATGNASFLSDMLGAGVQAAGLTYPILRIGEPTTFDGPQPFTQDPYMNDVMTGSAGVGQT